VLARDIPILSRAITLVESAKPEDQAIAHQVLDILFDHTGRSFRIGITGSPGVGKSTFIERYGSMMLEGGHRVAVLAIDPTSSRSRGSILGDKTRMSTLASHSNAYVRPSPSGGSLGGITGSTYGAILLCEAAGFDQVIVETVGVGQSEVAVSGITDFFVLLMLAGSGDELQGIKRGIMELADVVVITKADHENAERARRTRAEFSRALHLLQLPVSGWVPKALTCSATEGTGMKEVADTITQYHTAVTASGYLKTHRHDQLAQVLRETVNREILRVAGSRLGIENQFENLGRGDLAHPFRILQELLASLSGK
jgi:LAO/AO transport system kinase